MKYTVMIVSDELRDLERMKTWFPHETCRVKGLGSLKLMPAALRSEQPQIIAVCSHGNYGELFHFYEYIRTNESHKNIPLIIVTDISTQLALTRNVSFSNSRIIGVTATDDNLRKIVLEELEKISGE